MFALLGRGLRGVWRLLDGTRFAADLAVPAEQLHFFDGPEAHASLPLASTLCGSFDRSVSSGTLVCMRKAISYCAMRVAVSGSPVTPRRE